MLKMFWELLNWHHTPWNAHIYAGSGVHTVTLPVCRCGATAVVEVHGAALVMPCTGINAPDASVTPSYTSVGVSWLPVPIMPPLGLCC